MSIRTTAEWTRGRNGERIVADFLQRRGWFVIPSYDYSGEEGNKAPRMQGALISYVIPDLDTALNGERVWVEVKTKTAATETYSRGGRLEHGIHSEHADDYLAIEEITGTPVVLVIYELSTGVLLKAKVRDLMPTARRSAMRKFGRADVPMVFFDRAAFEVLGYIPSSQKEAA